jgi:hypothetical protein
MGPNMSWFFAGNKTTQVLLEHGGRQGLDFSDPSVMSSYKSAIATNYGTTSDNVSIYYVADDDAIVARITNGDQFVITWAGAPPSSEISGVSFAAWDAKEWIQFSASKSSILANGSISSIVYAKIYTADKLSIDTSYNGTLDIQIRTPTGQIVLMRFIFNKGQASRILKTTTVGLWNFPASAKTIDVFKVDPSYTTTINSVM